MCKIFIFILTFALIGSICCPPYNEARRRTRGGARPEGAGNHREPARTRNSPQNSRPREGRPAGGGAGHNSNRESRREPAGGPNNRREPRRDSSGGDGYRRNSRYSSSQSNQANSGSNRYKTPAEYLQKPMEIVNRMAAYMSEKALVPIEKTHNATGSMINRLRPTITEARSPNNVQQVLGLNRQQASADLSSPLLSLNIGSFNQERGGQTGGMMSDPGAFINWNDLSQPSSSLGTGLSIAAGTQGVMAMAKVA